MITFLNSYSDYSLIVCRECPPIGSHEHNLNSSRMSFTGHDKKIKKWKCTTRTISCPESHRTQQLVDQKSKIFNAMVFDFEFEFGNSVIFSSILTKIICSQVKFWKFNNNKNEKRVHRITKSRLDVISSWTNEKKYSVLDHKSQCERYKTSFCF